MNKNVRDAITLSLIAFGIFLLPTLFKYSFVEKKTDTFYQRVDEDFNDCVKNAGENPKDIRLCQEIKRASELAFSSSNRVADSSSNTSIMQGTLFVLAVIILNLKRRIEDLEQK